MLFSSSSPERDGTAPCLGAGGWYESGAPIRDRRDMVFRLASKSCRTLKIGTATQEVAQQTIVPILGRIGEQVDELRHG